MTNKSCLYLLFLILPLNCWAQSPTLNSSSDLATAGYYQLSWQGDKSGARFQLEESRDEGFSNPRILYEGTDTASVISGRHDGDYFYRIRQIDNQADDAWSEALKITVQHHSLAKAFSFFVVGLIVFLATLFSIYRGSRQPSL